MDTRGSIVLPISAMPPIELINAPGLPVPAGHYSHATRAGNLVCVSGQLPVRPDGSHSSELSFAEQAEQTLSNLRTVLEAAGAGLQDCIEVTVYLVGVEHWKAFNEIYARHFGAWKPARAVVPVDALHYGYLVEISARAWVERA
jgi:2-iminobutanoate/2-iminopropanoate deaminase